VEVIESGTGPSDEREPGFLDYKRLSRCSRSLHGETPYTVNSALLGVVSEISHDSSPLIWH